MWAGEVVEDEGKVVQDICENGDDLCHKRKSFCFYLRLMAGLPVVT